MHKIGLKLWSVNTGAYYTEAQKLYDRKLFDYIELYVLPNSLDRLERWKALQIPYIIHCAHSAHGFNLADKGLESSNRIIYEQTKRYADKLNAKYIIFHGGCDGTIEETARQLANFHEPRALIENKPMKPLPDVTTAKQCRGYSMEELQSVIRQANCGFCLDIGHAVCAANSMRSEPYQYVQKLMEFSPEVVHLSDITDISSEYDAHPNLGTGKLDLKRIFRMIPEKSVITIETNKNNGLDNFGRDVKVLDHLDISFKKVELADAENLYLLANDPQVRKNSFSSAPILWKEHIVWLTQKLKERDSFFCTVRKSEEFIGSIRIDREGDEQIISVSLLEDYRNKGLGAGIIKDFCKMSGRTSIVAYIKESNLPSLKSFQKAGFTLAGTDKNVFRLIWENNQ